MAEVLLFHHAHGITAGFMEFAEQLRDASYAVHTPDLYDGRTFSDLDAGVAYAEQVGFGEILARGATAAADLPNELVYAGFSLGALPAQALTQSRPGAKGALLFHGGMPRAEFSAPWPAGVPVQLHLTEGDPWCELDVCQQLAEQIEFAELYLYPGERHLFADSGSGDYDPDSAAS